MGPEESKSKLRYRIGDVVLDTATREVERGSQSLKIGGLTFDLFLALTEAAPALLTHDELAARVWPGRVVTPDTLTQRVRMLREALDDDAKSPTYVQLVRGQGYRL
ncbi:MAG: winged helix-turn-helix domain-containing protein, partial [Pseudomonadota bacterium]